MSFNDIVGHKSIKFQIENSIKQKRFSHAHIIAGEDGIGKSLIAKETAIKILGKLENKSYADIVEFKLNGKKSLGIDEIKKIIEETTKKPYEGNKKVIIVYSSDKMTETAQNAFLKTIEEPPNGIFIILLCEKLENILETIKSRCEIYKLNRLSEEEMYKFLNNNFNHLSSEQTKAISAFSDGIPGRAEKFNNNLALKEIRDVAIKLLKVIGKNNLDETLSYEKFFLKYKNEWQEVLTCMLAYIRDILIYKETLNNNMIINIDKINEIKDTAEMFSFNKLNGIVNAIRETRIKLEKNVNPIIIFDAMLIKMQEV